MKIICHFVRFKDQMHSFLLVHIWTFKLLHELQASLGLHECCLSLSHKLRHILLQLYILNRALQTKSFHWTNPKKITALVEIYCSFPSLLTISYKVLDIVNDTCNFIIVLVFHLSFCDISYHFRLNFYLFLASLLCDRVYVFCSSKLIVSFEFLLFTNSSTFFFFEYYVIWIWTIFFLRPVSF